MTAEQAYLEYLKGALDKEQQHRRKKRELTIAAETDCYNKNLERVEYERRMETLQKDADAKRIT